MTFFMTTTGSVAHGSSLDEQNQATVASSGWANANCITFSDVFYLFNSGVTKMLVGQ